MGRLSLLLSIHPLCLHPSKGQRLCCPSNLILSSARALTSPAPPSSLRLILLSRVFLLTLPFPPSHVKLLCFMLIVVSTRRLPLSLSICRLAKPCPMAVFVLSICPTSGVTMSLPLLAALVLSCLFGADFVLHHADAPASAAPLAKLPRVVTISLFPAASGPIHL